MNFYKHHIGDYAKKTAHLTVLEHGAYLLMLHAYYGTERPLPVGEPLYRMVRAQSKAERAAVDSIASQFWTTTQTGLVNGRAFAEIENATHLVENARRNGTHGGRPKKPTGFPDDNPTGSKSEPSGKAIQTPDSRLQYPDSRKRKSKISIPTESHSNAKPSEDVLTVFEHWQRVWNHPSAALDPKRRATIQRALKGYSVADLCESISGYRNSGHHCGQNDRNAVYDGLHLLLRDADHIDAGLRFAREPPQLSSKLQQHNVAVLQDWRPPELRDDDARLSEISGDDGETERRIRQRTLAGPH